MQLTDKEEIKFFYDLLYKYEHESKAGYKDKKVKKEIGERIIFDHQHKDGENITGEALNCIKFVPKGKNDCWAILYHVRNAFAHGNIQSVDSDKAFLIQDFSDKSKRSKCNMLCLIEKDLFRELIQTIEETRKKTRNKRKG